MTLLSRQNAPLLLAAFIAAIGWAYLPPFGPEIKLPDIAPFLEPDVPHAEPVFIHAGSNVYYRVRLKRLVPLSYARQDYEKMRREGVQWRPYGDSPFRPFARLRGWDVAFVREKSLKPYAIEYWKVSDNRNPSFPVKLRWPWLEVRLGADILKPPKVAVIVPERSVANVDSQLPLPPDAILTSFPLNVDEVQIDLLWPGERRTLARFFEAATGASFDVPDGGDPYAMLTPEGKPVRGIHVKGLRWLSIEVPNRIFSDEWVIVYTSEHVPRLRLDGPSHQPVGLPSLPFVTAARVRLKFDNPESAAVASRDLVRRPGLSKRDGE